MFYVGVIAFGIGIGIASVYTFTLPTIVWVTFLSLLFILVAKRSNSHFAKYLPILSIAILLFSIGILRTEWHKATYLYSPFSEQVGEEVLFSGVVVQEPDERERVTHLYIESAGEKVLITADRHHDISYGDEVLVSGEIEVPESFETDLGRTFNYPGYLQARGVTHRVSFADISVISEGNGNSIIAFLLQQKARLMTGIERVIEEPQAGLAEGLLLGVKQALGDDLELAFRQSGIIHIVVLSGYNVMLVVAFFMFFLSPLPRRVRMILGVASIAGFALLVGLSATVVRASIMASLFLFADAFSKTYNVLRMLCFAGAVMIFINPYLLLYDIGFQLSFMATLGLVLVAPQFETALSKGNILGAKEYFMATVATQIAVLPLLMYHIGEISLVAVLVNVLVLPVVPFAMLGAFVAGLLALVSTSLAMFFAYPTSLLLSYIILLSTWFASLPFATVVAPAFSPILILVLYGAITAVFWFIFYREKNQEESLDDWEVVEETVIKNTTSEVVSTDDTPIFFR